MEFSELVNGSPLDQLTAVVIVAHPDDEIINCGAIIRKFRSTYFVHVTDGAPYNMQDAWNAGFQDREDYAQARRYELTSALTIANREINNCISLGFVDQDLIFNLSGAVHDLAATLERVGYDLIITHAYEGGHPDHDAVAFIVHAVFTRFNLKEHFLIEFPSYHWKENELAKMEFLPSTEEQVTIELTPEEIELKQSMMECFKTQQKVIAGWPLKFEIFRKAPIYNFCDPPHSGKLFYEYFNFGVTGEQWRQLARNTCRELGIPCKM
jgi:N-acetylglucosamine malate deacetylase 2